MLSFGIALGCEILFLCISFLCHFQEGWQIFGFCFSGLVYKLLNWMFVYLLTELLGVPYLYAIVVSAAAISVLNYGLNKKIVFK